MIKEVAMLLTNVCHFPLSYLQKIFHKIFLRILLASFDMDFCELLSGCGDSRYKCEPCDNQGVGQTSFKYKRTVLRIVNSF